ncbi:helix-turn-helix domain-containing protein [Raoultibacter timonensis]|uniref:helix-turn-helix domain-containing protein n=1 Tax=Raoultibacter timonensis TaxID=1907662 RepID=UPI000C860FF8|nr:helix-turn-helix transcriptional regulator [Raoultibacter timonensis]
MNAPAITRDGASSGALPAPTFAVLVCGLGLYMGWQTVGISPTLFPQPHAGIPELIETTSYLQTALFLTLLAVVAWFANKRGDLLSSKPLVAAAAVLVCSSSACTYLCGWVLDIPAGVVAGTVLNASKAALLLLWAECLCRVRFRDALLCVSLAYAVVFALCLLVAGLQPVPALITHSVLPLLSGGALLVLRSDQAFYALQSPLPHEAKPLSRLPLRLFVGVGIFGAVILFTNTLSETKSSAAAELYTLLAGLAVSLFIAVFATRRSEKIDFTFLYRTLTPLIIASIIPVLTLESGHQQYEAFVIGVGWTFFRIFTWTLWCSIALRSRVPAACVFAAGQFALTACSTIAQITCDAVLPAIDIPFPVMISGVIVLTVGTSAFVMSESDIKRFFEKRKTAKRKPDTDESFTLCVQLAAQEYGLSKREEEIAELVMKDKNNAVIQERLCITESTLRTHLRNIYGKTSVHSRRELVDLLHSYIEDDA